MKRRTYVAGAVGGVGLVGAGLVASDLFLPERATRVDEADDRPATARPVSRGSFVGADAAHQVSGTVTLFDDDAGAFLRFEAYSQTQGPDVFVYLTPAPVPNTTAAIRAGVRVLVDGGADGGESTKTGHFTQVLPADSIAGVDLASFGGVGIWCDRFAVPFGWASLEPVPA